MPLAGIRWVRDALPAAAKILMGRNVEESGTRVTYTVEAQRRAEELVCDLLPGFSEYYRAHSKNKFTMGRTLLGRGAVGQVRSELHPDGNDELRRFRTPPWGPTWDKIGEALREGVAIDKYELHHLIEQRLELQYSGCPGVYLRQDVNCPEIVYVGETSNTLSRSRAHGGTATHYLCDVIATETKALAHEIESQLHFRILHEIGAVSVRPGRRGLYRFPLGVDGINAIRRAIASDPALRVTMRANFRTKESFVNTSSGLL